MDHGHWLYKPKDNRIYANKLNEILHFQFGDATATSPFRYHAIRSLGWLLYPFCHLQNRLRSKFLDHLFENLNQYFRSSSQADHERLVKLDLHNFGEIPESTQFVKQDERWQINMPLIELGFAQNKGAMDEAAAQYREGRETQGPTERETATAVMARVNAANALVGSLLANMYKSAKFQYLEIARRFCKINSIDPEVRKFRAEVLKKGVPKEALNVDLWEITPSQVIGAGNKTLEIAMADKLMAARPLHDPEAQRDILEIYDLANTDNPGLASRLTGRDKQDISDSVQKAQLMMGTLMLGVPVLPQRGDNPQEMVETLLHSMATIVQRMEQTGPKPETLLGLQTMAQTVGQYIQIFAQDKQQQNKAKEYEKDLQVLMAQVQRMAQALQKAAQAQQQQGNGGLDPKDAAKIQGMQLQAKVKADNMSKSHAMKTAQRQISFEAQERQKEQKHQQELRKETQRANLELGTEAAKTAQQIRRDGIQGLSE